MYLHLLCSFNVLEDLVINPILRHFFAIKSKAVKNTVTLLFFLVKQNWQAEHISREDLFFTVIWYQHDFCNIISTSAHHSRQMYQNHSRSLPTKHLLYTKHNPVYFLESWHVYLLLRRAALWPLPSNSTSPSALIKPLYFTHLLKLSTISHIWKLISYIFKKKCTTIKVERCRWSCKDATD